MTPILPRWLRSLTFTLLALNLSSTISPAAAPLPGWKHSGTFTVLTTPEGANLPAGAVVVEFPLLVRLHREWFDFAQAKADGADVRFTTGEGKTLPHQVEEWDAAGGTASIWVRVPRIEGNARQSLRMHWGKADAASASDGKAVFNEFNGYLSVWHLGDTVRDEVGTLESKDTGTSVTNGIIGKARHFPGKAGVFGGDKIPDYPTGASPHSTEVWFRTRTPNSTLIGWGNEQGHGKVVMQLRSPPHIGLDCYFSDGNVAGSHHPLGEWTHVVHTYRQGASVLYVNGQPEGTNSNKGTPLNIRTPARLWLGGWYHNYTFVGTLDEVRVSKVTRPAEWVRLQYENQKPQQTLVGPLVPAGTAFAVLPAKAVVEEGKHMEFTAQAGGAQKVYWVLKRDGREEVLATDRFKFTFAAGRVTGDATATLQLKAVFPDGVKTKDVAVAVKEAIPDPEFTLAAPAKWDGRSPLEIRPRVTNAEALRAAGAGEARMDWAAGPAAVTKDVLPGHLRLLAAQKNGPLTVTATLHNGGRPVSRSVTIEVTQPARHTWVARVPDLDEKPEEGQFYARDDRNEGTLHYHGKLEKKAASVFLRVFADDRPFTEVKAAPDADGRYALAAKLKAGLVRYRIEFGTRDGAAETVLDRVGDLVCGDAFLIEGQSNAEALDLRDERPKPREVNEWLRTYGGPRGGEDGRAWVRQNWTGKSRPNLWARAVWAPKEPEHRTFIGWWGMELGKRLIASQQVPVFILNGALGGTRVDQHQRTADDPANLDSIYGRWLWRLRQARLTHGIRAVIWHQGESDQPADNILGLPGHEVYQPFFLEMAAGWQRDLPNARNYFMFQIWPNACAMGGRNGAGDRIREAQRTLPARFANLSILATLGIRPPGGCHYPKEGYNEFARLLQPVIERDCYGKKSADPVTPPNLLHAQFTAARDAVTLEFDQPVKWSDALASQFYLDDEPGLLTHGLAQGHKLTLHLKAPSLAKRLTYLKESKWSQDTLLLGANGLAALTFCDVPIHPSR